MISGAVFMLSCLLLYASGAGALQFLGEVAGMAPAPSFAGFSYTELETMVASWSMFMNLFWFGTSLALPLYSLGVKSTVVTGERGSADCAIIGTQDVYKWTTQLRQSNNLLQPLTKW
jgi:hypothetical protein